MEPEDGMSWVLKKESIAPNRSQLKLDIVHEIIFLKRMTTLTRRTPKKRKKVRFDALRVSIQLKMKIT